MKQIQYINEILIRFVDGLYTHKDAETMLDSCHTHKHLTEVGVMMDKVWTSLDVEVLSCQKEDEYKKEARMLLNRIQKKEKQFTLMPLLKYAALLVILLSTGWSIYLFTKTTEFQNLTYTEINVKNGEHKQVVLPDGTKVILNAGSVMKFPDHFLSDQRMVEINGEAFFEVAHDINRPFIIKTKDANVRVLGTSFNVKAYDMDEQLLVSVRTGKVQVDMPEAMMRLLPNEQLVFNRDNGEILKKNEDTNRAIAWINGGLYFNKTPIHSVVKDLERMYNCKIVFSAEDIYDEYVYGEHDNKSLISVLRSIQYSTGIKYRKEGNHIVLYK